MSMQQMDPNNIKTLNLLTQGIKTSSNARFNIVILAFLIRQVNRNIAHSLQNRSRIDFNGLSTGNPTADVMVISGPHISPILAGSTRKMGIH